MTPIDLQQPFTGGIRIKSDRIGRRHVLRNSDTSFRAERARRIQHAILTGALDSLSYTAKLMGFLCFFEGICSPPAICSATNAVWDAYRWDQTPIIDWLDSAGRQDQRHLSPLTVALLPPLDPRPTEQQIKSAFTGLASHLYPEERSPCRELCLDVEAYLSEALPGWLFADVAGYSPITSLPRSALARQVSTLALASPDNFSENSAKTLAALGHALDHYFDGREASGSAWLVTDVVAITQKFSRENTYLEKQNMLDALSRLTAQVVSADRISALVLAWAIDLAEYGNIEVKNLKPRTVHRYVSSVAHQLHAALAGIDLEETTGQQFYDLYVAIRDATETGTRGNSITGLHSWHRFLVTWLGVPALSKSLDDVAIAIPKANMVWDAEFDRILSWLDAATIDQRLVGQVRTALLLAKSIRLRAKELFQLRMRNVIDHGDLIEVEVAPMQRDGSPKTKSGRRVQTVTDPAAINALRSWVSRRRAENALEIDLLWGNPHRPKQVHERGRMYVLLNRLLKSATGDLSISFHTLSHTWVTNRILDVDTNPPPTDIPPLEVIATAAGHRSSVATLSHYFHRPADCLARHLSREFAQIGITSRMASRWSGVSSEALRKRTSDQKRRANDVYWEAILAQRHEPALPPCTAGLELHAPAIPAYLSGSAPISLQSVIDTLCDLANDLPSEMVAARAQQTLTSIETLTKETSKIVSALATKQRRAAPGQRKFAGIDVLEFESLGIGFAQISQPKWRSVLEYVLAQSGKGAPVLADLVSAWCSAFDRGYLRMTADVGTVTLLSLLHSSGVSSSHVAIALDCNDPSHPSHQDLAVEAALVTTFVRVYGLPPNVDRRLARRSRPPCYLLWSRAPLPLGFDVPGAATSLAGFHALMLSVAVWSTLSGLNDSVTVGEKFHV